MFLQLCSLSSNKHRNKTYDWCLIIATGHDITSFDIIPREMRSRSNSGIKLDLIAELVDKSLQEYRDPVTGLYRNNEQNHSWIRDNVYTAHSVWALSLAYQKTADFDEDRCKAYEYKNSVIVTMRSLLTSMMLQSHKVELFKHSGRPLDSLHAKFNASNFATVVGDEEWGHLQMDAIGLFLLSLSQACSVILRRLKT